MTDKSEKTPTEKKLPPISEPGIYLGLPEERYFEADALGSTDMKVLAHKPWKWQFDRLHPKTKRYTDQMLFGSAVHCRVLEGKEAFDKRYAPLPSMDDYDGALVTTKDLTGWLKDNGNTTALSKLNKGELIDLVCGYDERPPIWDLVIENFNKTKDPRHEVLPEDFPELIEIAVENMSNDVTLRSIMQVGSLVGGAAEVSIFHEQDDVLRRGRYDYALPPMLMNDTERPAIIADLKNVSSFKGIDLEDSIFRYIYDNGLDIQATDYMEAYQAGKELVEAGKVFGEEPYEGYVKDFFSSDTPTWVWIFNKTDEGMIPVTVSIERDDMIFDKAKDTIDTAIRNYHRYMQEFGPDKHWTPPQRMPPKLNYSLFPNYPRGF